VEQKTQIQEKPKQTPKGNQPAPQQKTPQKNSQPFLDKKPQTAPNQSSSGGRGGRGGGGNNNRGRGGAQGGKRPMQSNNKYLNSQYEQFLSNQCDLSFSLLSPYFHLKSIVLHYFNCYLIFYVRMTTLYRTLVPEQAEVQVRLALLNRLQVLPLPPLPFFISFLSFFAVSYLYFLLNSFLFFKIWSPLFDF
jgi:hypothetical protein